MASSSSNSSDQNLHRCFFQEWINLQEQDLSELLHGLTISPSETNDRKAELTQLVGKNIKHFEDYVTKRRSLASEDVSAFFAPCWCTSLENSLLWIAGCRPSSFIRLVYALCGLEMESRLTEFLEGDRMGDIGGLSAQQLSAVNGLQVKTIHEEERLSNKMAGLQEDVADQPLALIAKGSDRATDESNGEAQKALDEHATAMMSMLEEADQLRLSTLKELTGMLSPVQAVDFLAAAKKLHLCMHMWGQKRDHKHGRF